MSSSRPEDHMSKSDEAWKYWGGKAAGTAMKVAAHAAGASVPVGLAAMELASLTAEHQVKSGTAYVREYQECMRLGCSKDVAERNARSAAGDDY